MKKVLADIKLKYQLQFIVIVVGISMLMVMGLFFYSFNQLTLEKADSYFEEISRQIEKRVSYTIRDIESSCKKVARSRIIKDYLRQDDIAEKNRSYLYMSNMLNNEIVLNNYSWEVERYIRSINIIDTTGKREQFYLEKLEDVYRQIIEDYKVSTDISLQPTFTKGYYSEEKGEYYFGYIEPIYSSVSQVTTRERLGTVVYICSTQIFKQIVEEVSQSNESIFMLVDSDHNILASNNHELIGGHLDNEKIHQIFKKGKLLERVIPIEEIGWELRYIISVKELTKDMNNLQQNSIFIIILTMVLILGMCTIIIQGIKGQLGQMTKECQLIGENSIKYRLKPVGNNEIGTLVKHINLMLDQIEHMTRKIVNTQDLLFTAEIEKKQATINALESQINPHFLYNTLECIRNIAMAYEAEEIEEMVVLMADIFRYSIKAQEIVSVKDEVQCIQNYFGIIRIRHNGRFSLEVGIDPAIMTQKIPKMILQPLVENAVNHGLEKRNGPGKVRIIGYYEKDCTIIEIQDNGVGIAPKQLEQLKDELNEPIGINNQHSIGIFNIHNRLRLTYGNEYGILYHSESNQGTSVKITIPNIPL